MVTGTIAAATTLPLLPLLALPAHAASAAPTPVLLSAPGDVQIGRTVRFRFDASPDATSSGTRSLRVSLAITMADCQNNVRISGTELEQNVDFRQLRESVTLEYAIPVMQGSNLVVCARQAIPGLSVSTPLGVAIQQRTWLPALPAQPRIVAGAAASGIPQGTTIQVDASMLRAPEAGDEIRTRELFASLLPGLGNIGDCQQAGSLIGIVNLAGSGAASTTQAVAVPAGSAGKWLCLQQWSTSRFASTQRSSTPLIVPVIAGGVTVPSVGNRSTLASAIERARQAATRLDALNRQPRVDRAALDAAVREASAARQAAQEAAAQVGIDANNAGAALGDAGSGSGAAAGGASAGEAAAVAEVVGQLGTQVSTALGESAVRVGTAVPASVLALAAATGIDPTATPLLDAGSANASGIGITLQAPASIARNSRLWTTLRIAPGATRGGMRQYLLRMDGGTPVVMQQRAAFIPGTGSRATKYWLPKSMAKGNYAILSTFQPSVPGTGGVALLTPLRVR